MKKKTIQNRYARKISSRLRKPKSNLKKPHRKNPWKKTSAGKTKDIRIEAPEVIDIYRPKAAQKTIKFIKTLKAAIKNAHKSKKTMKVRISFEHSFSINAPAAVHFYAELDRATKKYPNVRYSVSLPTRDKTPKGSPNLLDSVLNQIGIYKLLNVRHAKPKHMNSRIVKCWNIDSSEQSNMEKVSAIIQTTLGERELDKKVYRGLNEAIGNAAEHAYNRAIEDSGADLSDKRHWFLSSIQHNELYIYVCDLGHGIPYTLGKTETTSDPSLLDAIFKRIEDENSSKGGERLTREAHAKRIHAAILVKETRTKLKYRGKGGADLKRVVDDSKDAKMLIISRKGMYEYKNRSISSPSKNRKNERKLAIDGTVVGWSIPLSGDNK